MGKKRCFLAVKGPATKIYEKRLRQINQDLDVKISITDPIRYHFTLHFFGDITDEEIESIKELCEQIHFDKFTITLDNPGAIPPNKPSKVRVLHMKPSQGKEELKTLVNNIRDILKKGDFEIPGRNYLPHLTVARVRQGKDKEKIHHLWSKQQFKPVSFEVDKFVLVKSDLKPHGPEYSDLVDFNLN